MQEAESKKLNDPFEDYACFIAEATSIPLHNLKVEQYLELLDSEAQKWDVVPNKCKDSYCQHTLEYKATSLYWHRLFTQAMNLTDENFVFKCKRWVTSFLQMGRGKEELGILKDTFALSKWVIRLQLKRKLPTGATGATENTEDIIERKCEHWQTNPPRQFLSSPFVFPTEEEKKILAQGLVEHRGDLLRCLPPQWDAQQVGLFLFKNPWILLQSPKMEIFKKWSSFIEYNWDWKVNDGLDKLHTNFEKHTAT